MKIQAQAARNFKASDDRLSHAIQVKSAESWLMPGEADQALRELEAPAKSGLVGSLAEDLGDAKVGDSDAAFCVQQDVLRFDVAKDDALVVRELIWQNRMNQRPPGLPPTLREGAEATAGLFCAA